MKKIFLLGWLLISLNCSAFAGNNLGADLTYVCIAPGVYVVTFKFVQDCSPVAAPTTLNLDLKSVNCPAANRTVTLNRTGAPRIIQQFCPNRGPFCAITTQYQVGTAYLYSATVSFSGAEQACLDWIMGVAIDTDTRPATANLVGMASMYLEAYLNLRPGINNNSPEVAFLNVPLMSTFDSLLNYLSLNYQEQDGDSLVYSFRSAQQAYNSPINYKSSFNPQNPVVSNPAFSLNRASGEFIFKPYVVRNGVNALREDNRYSVVFQVDEFRKVNGVIQKIGSVQRDMIIEVFEPDTTTNHQPGFDNFKINSQPFDPNIPLILSAGQPITVTFDAVDPDTADLLKFTSGFLLPNNLVAVSVLNNFTKPQITAVFTPTTNHIQTLPYIFDFKVEDNGCPLKALRNSYLAIEVRGTLGTKQELAHQINFQAYPNPYTEELIFKFSPEIKAETILIYNLLGQEVDRIQLQNGSGQEQIVIWQNADKLFKGTYVARLMAGNKSMQTIKFTRL